jgi:hypothetical protein
MRRGFRVLTVAVSIALVGALAAPVAASAPAAKAKPDAWATDVCSALGDWVTKVEDVSGAATDVGATTPAEGKKALVKLVNGALKATKALVGDLEKAGAPAVQRGSAVAQIVRGQFEQVQSTLTNARATLKQLSTDDPAAFVSQSRAAQDAIEAGLESVQAALNAATDLDVAPLVAAFNEASACQGLTT